MSPHEATFVAHALSLAALYGDDPWPRDGHPLPDEPPRRSGDVHFPSVVYDGVSTHHRAAGSDSADELADTVLAHLGDPAPLLDLFAGIRAIDVADDLVRELRSRDHSREKLRIAARFVVEHATRREAAKLGIAVLGSCGDDRDGELLQLLGRLDEFSLFAVVALTNTQSDREQAVFELAQRLHGWGRIHAVERLAGSSDPAIRAWLLREGFRNGVMNEYLAYIAATTGGLYEALLGDDIDDALLDGAAGILQALAIGGPAEDMRDYEDAVPAMHRFADLLDSADPTVERLRAALSVARMCRSDREFPWPAGEPERLRSRYTALVAQRRWRATVIAAVELPPSDADGPETRAQRACRFDIALSCAEELDIDVLSAVSAQLRIDPLNAYWWQWVMGNAGDAIDEMVRLAEELLAPRVTSGPSEVLGIGPGYAADFALGMVVSRLRDHPGRGVKLIRAALSSRGVRCRRAALTTLTAWPAPSRPVGTRDWIRAAAGHEPDAELRRELLEFA
ncbi:hypothetical protein ACFYU5_02910 [Nocardia aobensis]|uniref:Uncharacterized protein n=1 Tax=Nocardia aobensis TaxID=257277 RepID=A0ABW6NVW7_9NOCA